MALVLVIAGEAKQSTRVLVIASEAKQSIARHMLPNASPAMTRKEGLPQIASANARLLILGSLPGEASLAAERYYAHPQNHFWRLLGQMLGTDLASLPYEDRLTVLQQRRIALWDVIASARRNGSLDQQLREVAPRDLKGFVAGLPELRAIGFNGKTAATLGRKALGSTPLALIDLPSSSPAYTLPFTAKAERWAPLRAWLLD
jgi:hypoxanthine-DNA glycosylase